MTDYSPAEKMKNWGMILIIVGVLTTPLLFGIILIAIGIQFIVQAKKEPNDNNAISTGNRPLVKHLSQQYMRYSSAGGTLEVNEWVAIRGSNTDHMSDLELANRFQSLLNKYSHLPEESKSICVSDEFCVNANRLDRVLALWKKRYGVN